MNIYSYSAPKPALSQVVQGVWPKAHVIVTADNPRQAVFTSNLVASFDGIQSRSRALTFETP